MPSNPHSKESSILCIHLYCREIARQFGVSRNECLRDKPVVNIVPSDCTSSPFELLSTIDLEFEVHPPSSIAVLIFSVLAAGTCTAWLPRTVKESPEDGGMGTRSCP